MGLLDEKAPDWPGRISLEALDLEDCEMCVLGQLYGNFWDGFDQLDQGGLEVFDPITKGFDADDQAADPEGDYRALTREWVVRIRARQEAPQ